MGDAKAGPRQGSTRPRYRRVLLLGGLGALALLAAGPTAFPAGGGRQEFASDPEGQPPPESALVPLHVPPLEPPSGSQELTPAHASAASAAQRATAAAQGPSHLVAAVRPGGGVSVYDRPGGPAIGRFRPRTEFGSPRRLAVLRRRGPWLGVASTARPNNVLAWVHARDRSLALGRTRWSVRIDLSRRALELRRGRRVVRTMRVAIGRPGSTTPLGRFAVTDKLPGRRFGSYYGCCIVALSAFQPNLPPGWRGGNRVAIHGTNVPASIGRAVTAGCPRASARDIALLVERLPLGAPVDVVR